MTVEQRARSSRAPAAASTDHGECQDHADPLEATAPLIATVVATAATRSTPSDAEACLSSPTSAKVAVLNRPAHRLMRAGKKIVVGSAAVVVIAAKVALAPRSGGPLAARVALPEPCRRRPPPPTSAAAAARGNYQSVPGSLELFWNNSVVCPGQTPDDLRDGVLASASPEQWEEYRRGSGGGGRGLIVFKRGGSGSTWFDTLLGKHPDVDFRHEAHHTVYRRGNGARKSTAKMRKFLKGEAMCRSPGGMCGFSISPSKHAAGVDWEELIRDTGASLVVFVRTNVLKRILGLTRKKQVITELPKDCRQGSSYKVNMDSDPKCKLSESIVLPAGKLNGMENACYMQSWEILEVALRSGAPFQIITYEGMQQNLTLMFDRLGLFTGWPLSSASFDWSGHVATAKVTSEDLRKTISNYDQLEKELEGKSCFLDMLHSEAQQLFPLCHIPLPNMTQVGAGKSSDE